MRLLAIIFTAALGVGTLARPVFAHPTSFDWVTATLEDVAAAHEVELAVRADGRYAVSGRFSGMPSEASGWLTSNEVRQLTAAVRAVHVAGLPAVAPGTIGQRTLTLGVRSGGRTYGHVTEVGSELPRVRSLAGILLDLIERQSPPEPRDQVEGRVVARGREVLLETRRGVFPVRRSRSGAEPLPRYWDSLLELLVGARIALQGRYDASGRWVDARTILARAGRALDVKTFPDDGAAPNTFTGGPDGRLRSGTAVRVFGVRGDWAQIDRLGGPVDAYAFVRLAGLDFDLDGAADPAAVRATAVRLGDLLARRLDDAGVFQVPTHRGELSEFRPLLERAFGPALTARRDVSGNVVHGGRLVWNAQTSELEPRTVDGHPIAIVYGLWWSQAFFYQPTVIDTVTGEVFQGKSEAAAGAGPLTFFGPLLPPTDARLLGVAGDQFAGLDAVLRERVSARAGR